MKYQVFILSTLTAAMLASCGKKEQAAAVATEELPIVTVDVAHRIDVPQNKVYTANVEAENINNIAPATPNRIKSINVEVGDRVRKGQVLVELDKSNIDQLRINLEQIEREYNRAVQLLQIGAGTQQAVDQLKAQLDAAKSQYDNLLENTVLRSPITGVVTARNYDPGDMTGSLPVLTVGQLAPVVKVMINVSENDLATLRQGQPVDVTFDAYPGETFDLGTQQNVVVPDRAVVKQTGSGNKYVYVLKGNTVSYNRVDLGQRLDNAYELLSGIEDGDTVVITGQTRLADGVKVEVK